MQFAFHTEGVTPSDRIGGVGTCVGEVVGTVVVVVVTAVDVVVMVVTVVDVVVTEVVTVITDMVKTVSLTAGAVSGRHEANSIIAMVKATIPAHDLLAFG